MQFSTIALLLSAIIAPSAAEYVCHSDASFTYDADGMPSAAAQKYLGSALVDAFNEAYENVADITMDSDDIEDVSNYIYFVMLLLLFLIVVVVVEYALISILSLTKLIHSHSQYLFSVLFQFIVCNWTQRRSTSSWK